MRELQHKMKIFHAFPIEKHLSFLTLSISQVNKLTNWWLKPVHLYMSLVIILFGIQKPTFSPLSV